MVGNVGQVGGLMRLPVAGTGSPVAPPAGNFLWTESFEDAENDLGFSNTRATDQYVTTDTDNLFPVPAGAIPIQNARPVRNLAASSDTPSTQNITVVVGRIYAVRIGDESAASATAVCSGAFTGTLTGDATDIQTFTTGKTATTTTLTVTITGSIRKLQVQDITHRSASSVVPDEYVDSATDYGTGVAGFRYFLTALANTVDGSGKVTELTGAALTGIALANVPGATNLADGTHDFSGGADTITLSSTGYYTLWLGGTAQVTIAAGTATITGAGSATEGSPVTINCTATGTVALTLDSGTLDEVNGSQVIMLEPGTVPTAFIPTSGSTASTDAAVLDFSGVTGFTTPNETRIVATGLGACELQDPSFDSDGSDWSDTGTITSSYDDGAVTLVNAAGYDGIYQNTVAPIPIGTTLLYVIDVKSISGGTITLQGKGVLNVGGATFAIASASVVGVFAGIKITTSVINSIAVRNSTAGTTTVVNGVYVFEIDPTSDVETIIDVDNWDGTDLSDILPHANVISVTQYAPGDRP